MKDESKSREELIREIERLREENNSLKNGGPYNFKGVDFLRLLENVVDSSPVGLVIQNADSEVVYVNSVVCDVLGCKREEIIGQNALDFIPGESIETVEKQLQIRRNNRSESYEIQMKHRDGSLIYIRVTGIPIIGKNNEYLGSYAFLTDITDLKISEQERRISEERYKYIIENATQGIAITQGGKIVFCNKTTSELSGYPVDVLKNIPFIDLIHPDDRERSMKRYRDVLNGNHKQHLNELRMVDPDGNIRWFEINDNPIIWNERSAILHFFDEITSRKKTEALLKANEETASDLINATNEMALMIDKEGVVIAINAATATSIDKDPDDLIGENIFDHFEPEIRDKRLKKAREVIESGEPLQYEDIAGEDRVYLTNIYPLFDNNGRVDRLAVFMRNTSEEKKTRQQLLRYQQSLEEEINRRAAELKESEEKYRLLVENVNAGIALVDYDGKFLFINSEGAKNHGKPASDVIGKTMWELFPEEVADYQMMNIRKVIETNEEYSEESHTYLDNEWQWYYTNLQPYKTSSGKTTLAMVIAADITKHKEADKKILESEERMRLAIENIPVMVIAFGEQGNVIVWNKECERVTGYSADEMVNNPKAFETVYPEPAYQKEIKKIWGKYGANYRGWETKLVARDGSTKYVEWSNISGELAIPGWSQWGVGVDVTKKKQAQEALRESEQKFRTIFESAGDAIFIKDENLRYVDVNPTTVLMANINKEDFLGKNDVELWGEEISEIIGNSDSSVLKGDIVDIEFGIPWENDIKYYHVIKVPVRGSDGDIIGLCGIARDITERKKAEKELRGHRDRLEDLVQERAAEITRANASLRNEIIERKRTESALRDSEEMARVLINVPSDIVILTDRETTILDINDAGANRFGRKPGEMIGLNMKDLLPENVRTSRVEYFYKVLETGEQVRFEDERDSVWFDNIFYPIFDSGGKVARVAVFSRDITEIKEYQQKLKESAERYRVLFESAGEGIIIAETATRKFRYVNPEICRMLGYSEEELVNMGVHDIHPKEKLDFVFEKFQFMLEHNYEIVEDIPVLRKDGKVIYADISGGLATIDGVDCIVGFFRDISARREAQKAYRSVVDNSPQGLVIMQNRKIVFANRAFLNMIGLSDDAQFVSSLDDGLKYFHPDDREKIRMNIEARIKGEPALDRYEIRAVPKGGSTAWWEVYPSLIEYSGRPAIQAAIINVTKRKEAEIALRESEDRFRMLSEAAIEGVIIHENGKIIDLNESAARMTGRDRSELIGYNAFDLMEQESSKYVQERVIEGYDEPIEVVGLKNDGSRFPAEILGRNIVYHGQTVRIVVFRDITRRKKIENDLRQAGEELEAERQAMENKNIALSELLNQIKVEKEALQNAFQANIKNVILPQLLRIKDKIEPRQQKQFEHLERELETVTSEFSDKTRDIYSKLTPREVEICRMIKNGFLSKEISQILNVSILTVHKHRELIRKKLGIKNKKINLSSYLQSL